MNKTHLLKVLFLVIIALAASFYYFNKTNKDNLYNNYPITFHEHEEENPDKNAEWTPEQASRHQKILEELSVKSKKFKKTQKFNKNSSTYNYANGNLSGNWTNRGPKNMPGAFKFAEMLDGTDIIYGVTHNHYPEEYNSKAYIFKGTVYNPTTGTGGDDFVLLTANWPNRYKNLHAVDLNGTIRLIAHIENGPLYYSDDEGSTWTLSSGLPSSNMSSIMNRQDNNSLYVTDGTAIYKSIDHGVSFIQIQNFGSFANSSLYTPRYASQPNSNTVYLARNGSFYTSIGAIFTFIGTYSTGHNNTQFSIGGDSRKLYITVNKQYWVSTDQGNTWSEKFPHGNYYGNTSGKMSAGRFLAVNPENEEIVLGGYVIPIISIDGLDNVITDHTGWGRYQNGTSLPANDYYDRIRFNYHPDFQSSHFFYNSSGNLLSVRCSDGGLFVSYKEWFDFPNLGEGPDNSGYANAHYININVLNTINPLIYRYNLFTGNNDTNHIVYSTQDQGSGSIIPGTNGVVLDFYQSIGGDGPPLDSYDGESVWKWRRQGNIVYAPVSMYNGGVLRTAGQINSLLNASPTVNFSENTNMGWVQTVIDHDQPGTNIWILSKNLDRATWNGTSITGHTVDVGTNQVAALAQAWGNSNKLFMLQDAKVFISNDRGNSFGTQIATPFSMVSNSWAKGDIGSGVVLPNNDNWILFCGPSANNVGSILSKDGGATWIDVTGVFPANSDAQTGGMVVTPDSKFVFAGTDIGPYVFDVIAETWYSIAEGIGFFNATDVDYITATNTVRFASWGSGILDFKIEESSLATNTNVIDDTMITIFPNPAEDYLYLRSSIPGVQNFKISLFNINGKEVYNNENTLTQNTKHRINITNLSSGVYTAKIVLNGNHIIIKKILKK
ncbi:T9SS type A sorting domain-containing protein [Bacteroidota bacterium]